MNKIFTVLLALFCFIVMSKAQKIEKYYDHQKKPCKQEIARFYTLIVQTDSGWLQRDYLIPQQRLQMQGLYKDSTCNYAIGHFYYYHANGNLQSIGKYEDNNKQGLWLGYYADGQRKDSTVYIVGEITGTSLKWHNNGLLSDSVTHSSDGTGTSVSWFDNGNLSSTGSLIYINQLNDKWTFFHPTGKVSAFETYRDGLLTEKNYFDENGNILPGTEAKSHNAEFAGGISAWSRYIGMNARYPPGYGITNSNKVIIVAEFTIDEEGNVKK
jgi:antitoxin component YwqK of YwqJK toxin-antitoxin module